MSENDKVDLGDTNANGGIKVTWPTALSTTGVFVALGLLWAGVSYVTDTRALADDNEKQIVLIAGQQAKTAETVEDTSKDVVELKAQMKIGISLMERALNKLDKIDATP
jgi:uncharacterized protein YdgA (DUF945 family)